MKPVYIMIDEFGDKYYFSDKEMELFHREDGPAIEFADGSKYWCVNDKLHRKDGPAIEHVSGTKEWYINGERHREDGPAIEFVNGNKFWYLNGKYLSEEEFNRRMKPSCEGKVVEIEGKKYKLTAI